MANDLDAPTLAEDPGLPAVLGAGHLDVPPVSARLWLRWSDQGLVSLAWCPAGSSAQSVFGAVNYPTHEVAEPYGSLLRAYLKGEDVDPVTLPVDLRGTAFQNRVWEALRKVPRGHVRSYAGIANDIGHPRAMRAVGSANGKNEIAIVVPCHRVIAAGMNVGGYTGGVDLKRFLLQLEGVSVVGDHVEPGQLNLL
jgi:methylated-DNA-[protein]-cysteine S-methyltransferase